MPKKILVITEFGSINGGENSFLTAASTFATRDWTFQVLAPQDSDLASAVLNRGLTHVPFSFFDEQGRRKPLPDLRNELKSVFATHQPDLVHANSLSTSRVAGPVAADLAIPSLGYLRDIMRLNKQVIYDINQLDRIVAVSHATRDFHIQQGLSKEKSLVIYNGIDFEQFHPAEREFKPPFRLMFVGQIGMRKGIDTLLDALSKLDNFPAFWTSLDNGTVKNRKPSNTNNIFTNRPTESKQKRNTGSTF